MSELDLDYKRGGNENLDPITGAPGAHPIGTALGATMGGAAADAIVGGLAGKGVAESVDPTLEDAYWREHYSTRPYVDKGASFDDYGPAYGYGVNSFGQHRGRTFAEAEPALSRDWDSARGSSSLGWGRAKNATRDAWNRVSDATERAIPGDSDRDGK